LSANLSDGGLSLIDPNLGAGYNVGTSGSYTTGVPFGAGNPQAPNTGSGSSSPLQKAQSELYVTQDYLNRINAEYEKVKQNYKQNCQSSGMSCTAAEESAFVDVMKNYADSIKAAEDKLAQLKDEIDAIQKGAGSPQSSRSLVSPPVVDSGNPGKTLTQKMADIFQ
jgi:hypothetical protein